MSIMTFKGEDGKYNIFRPGQTLEALCLPKGEGKDQGADDKNKPRAEKGKGKGKFNLAQVPIEAVPPLMLRWIPIFKKKTL